MMQKNLISLLSIIILDSIARGLIVPVLINHLLMSAEPFIIYPLDIVNYTDILYMALPIAMLVTPVVGFCSDTLGRKPLLLACLLISLTCYCIILLQPHYYIAILLILLLYNIRFSIVSLARVIIVDQSHNQPRATWLARISTESFITLGTLSAAAYVIFYINQTWFNTSIIVTAIILQIIALTIAYGHFSESLPTFNRKARLSLEKAWIACLAIGKHSVTLLWLGLFFLFQLAWSLQYQYLFWYLNYTYQFSDVVIFQQLQLSLLINIIVLLVVYPIAARYISNTRLLLITFLIQGILLILWPLWSVLTIWWAITLIGANLALNLVLLINGIANTMGRKHQGLLIALTVPCWMLAWGSGETLVSLVASYHLLLPFQLAGLLLITCFFITYYSKQIR